MQAEVVDLCRAICEVASSFAVEKRDMEEACTGLTLRVATLSAVPAFPGDPTALARKYIGVAIAVLEVAYLREGSYFQVRKGGHGKEIYEKHIETLGTRGVHLPPVEDETLFFEVVLLLEGLVTLVLQSSWMRPRTEVLRSRLTLGGTRNLVLLSLWMQLGTVVLRSRLTLGRTGNLSSPKSADVTGNRGSPKSS
ncbi:hypothetical protein CJ030_MR2G025523 [Morella rubra]|uniref:Uncharacterized protein n=1 Tax=Morella rubra TaxID=262757 RepID=A0A6A1WAS5_9ROSI|nr:hypothetical protein CJ030_MR2G025523 [Morella rubra]